MKNKKCVLLMIILLFFVCLNISEVKGNEETIGNYTIGYAKHLYNIWGNIGSGKWSIDGKSALCIQKGTTGPSTGTNGGIKTIGSNNAGAACAALNYIKDKCKSASNKIDCALKEENKINAETYSDDLYKKLQYFVWRWNRDNGKGETNEKKDLNGYGLGECNSLKYSSNSINYYLNLNNSGSSSTCVVNGSSYNYQKFTVSTNMTKYTFSVDGQDSFISTSPCGTSISKNIDGTLTYYLNTKSTNVNLNVSGSYTIDTYTFNSQMDFYRWNPEKQRMGILKVSHTNTSETKNVSANLKFTFTISNDCSRDFKNTVKDRIELYENLLNNKNLDYTNLLNFNITDANTACSNAQENNFNVSCSASYPMVSVNSTYDDNNISNYNTVVNLNGKKGYCFTSINLQPTTSYMNSVSSIYSKNKVKVGQLYFNADNGELLEGSFEMTCYFEDSPFKLLKYLFNSELSVGKVSDYIDVSNVYLSDESNSKIQLTYENINIKFQRSKTSSNTERSCTNVGDLFKCTFKTTNNSLKIKIPMQTVATDSGNVDLGYGIVSDISNPGIEDYKFSFGLKSKFINLSSLSKNSTCSYLSYDTGSDDNLFGLEFEVIDTTTGLVSKDGSTRSVGSNWCYNGHCKSDDANELINSVIKSSNNSYNSQNIEPLYSLLLDSSTIRKIRTSDNTLTISELINGSDSDNQSNVSKIVSAFKKLFSNLKNIFK